MLVFLSSVGEMCEIQEEKGILEIIPWNCIAPCSVYDV